MGLKWDQAEEIAEVLTENHPGINPLQVRFTDLRQWVADLDEFDDDVASSSEVQAGSDPDGLERDIQRKQRRITAESVSAQATRVLKRRNEKGV